MTELLTRNSKIRNSGGDTWTIWNWGIPAYRSNTGLVTCPMAGQCGESGGCYALQGAYRWSGTVKAYEYRLAESLRAEFTEIMRITIEAKLRSATRDGRKLAIRIHDSGDFYSLEYAMRWIEIANSLTEVQFYAYTKMVPMFQKLRATGKLPTNMCIIYSEGGLADRLINTSIDRHSRVFNSLAELTAAGYDDVTDDDSRAFTSTTGRIGLVYHGIPKRKWNTAA